MRAKLKIFLVEIKQKEIRKKVLKWIFSSIKIIFVFILTSIIAISTAVLVRTFIFDIRVVPTASMSPAIKPGEYIIVEKLSFGPRKPERLDYIPWFGVFFINNQLHFEGRFWNGRMPIRNEVVVFSDSTNVYYVKRAIGLPGDSILIAKNQVFIGNNLFTEAETVHWLNLQITNNSFIELQKPGIPDSATYFVESAKNNQYNAFFFMGDNRSFSHDSRATGTVKHEQIDGRAVVVFSLKRIAIL